MSVDKLEDDVLRQRLDELHDWQLKGNRLCREFRFRDFREAFGFMTATAKMAEKMQHHPEWHNLYSWVNVELYTHKVMGITELDIQLAKCMDSYARQIELRK